MHILVTGAAGFIGSHLVEQLLADRHAVTGVDAFTPYYDPAVKHRRARRLAAHGAVMRRLDLATDALAPVLSGVDAVIHAAAQPGLSATTSHRDFKRNNVVATARLCAALQHRPGVPLVHLSSSSVYGTEATGRENGPTTPASDYGHTKLQAERIVHTALGARACRVRLFSVYGPRERPDKLVAKAARCALTRRPFPLYRGSERHRRSFTDIVDAVRGLTAVLERFERCAGEAINWGRPATATTARVLHEVARAADRPLCIRRVPARSGDQRRTRARIGKARRLLGIAPTTDLRTGIPREVAWVRQRIRNSESGMEDETWALQ